MVRLNILFDDKIDETENVEVTLDEFAKDILNLSFQIEVTYTYIIPLGSVWIDEI
jgi:hypothetical protein